MIPTSVSCVSLVLMIYLSLQTVSFLTFCIPCNFLLKGEHDMLGNRN